jgi:hypothetical protein
MTATVGTTENRSKKNSKEKKNHRCDSILLHINKEKDRRKEKRNLCIKRDNVNIVEQFYAMLNMLPSFGSWKYAREEKIIIKDLFLSFSLPSYYLMQVCYHIRHQ